MIKHVGYPKCVRMTPFTKVHSPAEERAWIRENGEIQPPSEEEVEFNEAITSEESQVFSEKMAELEGAAKQLEDDQRAFEAEKAQFESGKAEAEAEKQSLLGQIEDLKNATTANADKTAKGKATKAKAPVL